MKKDQLPGIPKAPNEHISQPRVDLPISIEEIVKTDVILTHNHFDHWDDIAAEHFNKNIPFFVQNKTDMITIQASGFTNVKILDENGIDFEGIKLYKVKAMHASPEILKCINEAGEIPFDSMGVIFKAENHKTLYIAGDTIWCNEIKENIDKFSPDIIIISACGAKASVNGKLEKIIMDIDDVKTISSYAKNATIIASHMDTISHLTVTRDDIKNLKLHNVLVPSDNETLKF